MHAPLTYFFLLLLSSLYYVQIYSVHIIVYNNLCVDSVGIHYITTLVPGDFFNVLSKYTRRGCRVLAVAHRSISVKAHKIDKINRQVHICNTITGRDESMESFVIQIMPPRFFSVMNELTVSNKNLFFSS